MKVVVPIPVNGRLPLVKLTVQRLYEKNKAYRVILIGHEPEAAQLAVKMDCEWIEHPNSPLGAKWNAGFMAAKKYKPDAVLFAGSSDWISDNYFELCSYFINEYEAIGKLGCHFVDKRNGKLRLVNWPGYRIGPRANETIGIGRMISYRILDKIGWSPFRFNQESSMDYWMQTNILNNNGRIKILDSHLGKLLSISCDQWQNKHNFEDHWLNILPSNKMQPYPFLNAFPEIELL